MKTTINLTSRPEEDKSSSLNANPFWPILRFPVQMGVLLFLVLLGVPQAWALPHSIWNDATVPAILAADDPGSVEVGLKFRSLVNGYITGVRFYKGEGNTGTHVGNLWASDGTPLATVEFVNETDSGWQTQAFTNPVPISANTTCVASYHAPNGHYAVDPGYFGSGVDNPPLRALANGEDGGNGVYAYGPGNVFPSQTYNAANYWVDVVFVETLTQDTNPPSIVCPPDVILSCADCNTDPANTGTAMATDDSSVTVTYLDMISGDCPRVVKRTWKATDAVGNTACCQQTITCLPPALVTDSAGCIFDRDSSTAIQDFRLVFVQDPKNRPCQGIVASNPGQFLYNVFYSGSPGQQVTFDLMLPYPFVTQGANPIHAYDSVTVKSCHGQQSLMSENAFFVGSQQVGLADYGNPPGAFTTIPVTLTVPDSGVVRLVVHLNYGLKKSTGYKKDDAGDAVDCATGTNALVPNHGDHTFSVSGAQNGSTTVQNDNSFKGDLNGKGPGLKTPHMKFTAAIASPWTTRFGFTITGSGDLPVVVEICTNLANPGWIPLQTTTPDSDSSDFTDPQGANSSVRFYRLRWP